MRFVADAMLGRLARHLRLLGIDVAYDPSADDNEVIRRSLAEGRTILTRDTGLASRPLASNRIIVTSDRIDEQIAQVIAARPELLEEHPLTRCSVCNNRLVSAPRDAVRDLIPDHILHTISEFQRCKECGRIYWKGSHVRRIQRRLEGN